MRGQICKFVFMYPVDISFWSCASNVGSSPFVSVSKLPTLEVHYVNFLITVNFLLRL